MMKKNLMIVSLCLMSFVLYGCAYTQKLKDKFLPDNEFKETVVKADAAMHDGDWGTAAFLYRKAANLKPDQLQFLLKEADAHRSQGNQAQAYNLYQVIIESHAPSNPENDNARKEALISQKKLSYKPRLDLSSPNNKAPQTLIKSAKSQSNRPVKPQIDMDDVETPATTYPYDSPNSDPFIQSLQSADVDQQTSKSEIMLALKQWRDAWESKDLKRYLGAYSKNFSDGKLPYEAWQKSREISISQSNNLKIDLTNISLKLISKKTAIVSFRQSFNSDRYHDQGVKKLKFVSSEGRWLIEEESFEPESSLGVETDLKSTKNTDFAKKKK